MNYRLRRIISALALLLGLATWLIVNPANYEKVPSADGGQSDSAGSGAVDPLGVSTPDAKLAKDVLEQLEIKGRAPKTGYARTAFYKTWPNVDGCSLRQIIIKREVGESVKLDGCDVVAGTFVEPYTGNTFTATQKSDFSNHIQIDHVVALSDAWQKGAQYKSAEERYAMATDPLNLLAVDASANQQKSDGDAATWLPSNKAFRCQYVARQISVKYKYGLWVTEAEHNAIADILQNCPNEPVVGI
ncbi:HNH endonuclease [Candidatus Saccharibacteria bacterium]|nr:HNH endonuclease [Candidatus Saccharibacteria bacterium]